MYLQNAPRVASTAVNGCCNTRFGLKCPFRCRPMRNDNRSGESGALRTQASTQSGRTCAAPRQGVLGQAGLPRPSTGNQYSVVKQPPGKRPSTDVPGNHAVKPTKRTQS